MAFKLIIIIIITRLIENIIKENNRKRDLIVWTSR